MSTQKESIEWVAVSNIVLDTNARTIKPSKDRINEYARSRAMYGILVPLIADKKGDRNAHIGCITTQQLLRFADMKGLRAIVLDPGRSTELYISQSDLNRPLGINPVQFAPLQRGRVKPSIISRETRASCLKRT